MEDFEIDPRVLAIFAVATRRLKNLAQLVTYRLSEFELGQTRKWRPRVTMSDVAPWSQPVAATHWLNLSAGDWKSSVFLGRSLS